ncbi:uncharacterized protein LOC142174400 [Nicotiana tabacum]|uniref:Uncharacterized protein LOC142174400 n=1 Tax=Nicotiana tabacum TaxID=4097 RepID=A0AC58TGD4_TOBAC
MSTALGIIPKNSGMHLRKSIVVNEAFQLVAMIEKLPHSWRDFKNYLKHKCKEMKLEDLLIHLKIEEDKRIIEKMSHGYSTIMGANIAEKKKDKKRGHSNIVEKNDDIDDLCVMLSEYNLVGNLKEWWIDYGATRHVCAVKDAFATYSTAGSEKEPPMGNTATTKIEGYVKIFLKITYGKDEANEAFKKYKNEVENQLNKKIKMIRNDRSGEYKSPFAEIC